MYPKTKPYLALAVHIIILCDLAQPPTGAGRAPMARGARGFRVHNGIQSELPSGKGSSSKMFKCMSLVLRTHGQGVMT